MIHAHMTAWLLAIILFIVTFSMQSKGKNVKVLKMVLRLSYLLIIATGGMLISAGDNIPTLYYVKALLGIGMIGLLEAMIGRSGKGKSVKPLWIVFVVVFAALLYLGFTLPLGTYIQ